MSNAVSGPPDGEGGQRDESATEVHFLPVNHVESPAEATRQRAYLSCDACRRRKSRCIPSIAGQRHPCRRCVDDGKYCEFRASRSVGTRRSNRGRLAKDDPSPSVSAKRPGTSTSEQSFSVNAAADVSMTLNSFDADQVYSFDIAFDSSGDGDSALLLAVSESNEPPQPTLPSPGAITAAAPTARSRIIATRLHDTADALDLLTLAAAGVQDETSSTQPQGLPVSGTHRSRPSLILQCNHGLGQLTMVTGRDSSW